MNGPAHRPGGTAVFYAALALIGGLYVGLIAAMLVADAAAVSPDHVAGALASPEVRSAVWLSLLSSSASAILSVWVAVPLGYLLARTRFPGKWLVDLLIDVPVVLSPMVVGLSLLLLFQSPPGLALQRYVTVTYAVPAVALAQFTVAAAFAVRTMQVTFERIPTRSEEVAMTLGCSRGRAFWLVTLPEAWRGVVAAGTLAWARSLGEFGPVYVFAGIIRNRTEVLPSTVFLQVHSGSVEGALAVSLLMIAVAGAVLLLMRAFRIRGGAV